jgi:hypothetical protein
VSTPQHKTATASFNTATEENNNGAAAASRIKAITLAHYPKGLPTLDTFHTVELPLPAELQPGEVRTRR